MTGGDMLQEKLRELLARLDEMKAEEARWYGAAPAGAPPGGATEEALASLEAARGARFPEALRALLALRDGCPQFYDNLDLLGTADLSTNIQTRLMNEMEDYVEEEAELKRLKTMTTIAVERYGTRRLLLDGEAVIEHDGEELNRFGSLEELLRQEIDNHRQRAEVWREKREAIAREWRADFRAVENAALAERLKSRLSERRPVERTYVPPPSDGAEPSSTAPEDLAIRADGQLKAVVQKALTLHLGFYPSPEEIVSALQAVERRFPHRQRVQVFRTGDLRPKDVPDPATADWSCYLEPPCRLGYFGLRVSHKLNFKWHRACSLSGIRPFHDDSGERVQGSYFQLLLPPASDPEALYGLALELVELLPVRSGHGGYTLVVPANLDDDDEPEVRGWTKRYFGLHIEEPDRAQAYMWESLGSANWLTILGKPFLEALSLPDFSDEITCEARKNGLIIRAGDRPTLGDVEAGQFPELTAEVDCAIAPLRHASYCADRGRMGPGFAPYQNEFDFFDAGETALWFGRFQRPDRWREPDARELSAEIRHSTEKRDFDRAAEAVEKLIEHGTWHRGLDATLINAGVSAHSAGNSALAYRLCEVATQIHGCDLAAYANLLTFAMRLKDEGKIRQALEIALPHGASNPGIFYNAACAYAMLGEKEKAFECIRQAKAQGYDKMDLLYKDESFDTYRGTPEFEELFK